MIVVDALVEDFALADAAAKRIAQMVRFNALDAAGKVSTGEALATFARCDAATFILAMETLGKDASASLNRAGDPGVDGGGPVIDRAGDTYKDTQTRGPARSGSPEGGTP